MSKLRGMIDAIAADNFDMARESLKASLAEYMSGKKYVSNEEVFGLKYKNPNDEEQKQKAELTEAKKIKEGRYKCNKCRFKFDTDDYDPDPRAGELPLDGKGDLICPKCQSGDLKFLGD